MAKQNIQKNTQVVAIGEVMAELARGSDGRFGMSCGGGTFNTAVYLAPAGVGRLLAIVEMARQKGAKVAFDGNFRPYGWKGDLPRTRTVFMEALKRVDYALPTFDDEAVLWGDPSPEATVARMQAFGIGEIVVKNGPNSALVAVSGQQEHVPVPERSEERRVG